jgi:uncharacterized membrane protein YagU involved in acid resistance
MNSAIKMTLVGAALWGGSVAGLVDILVACLINDAGPVLILQTIASGALGKAAYGGGLAAAGLGLLLQWSMSNIIALLFVTAARWLPALSRGWIVGGLAYGVVIFFTMHFIVVPLSAVPRLAPFTGIFFAENLGAMLLFGLIVAFHARQHSID